MNILANEQMKSAQELERKVIGTNEQLRILFCELIAYLKRKMFAPGRISGMNIFVDFEE